MKNDVCVIQTNDMQTKNAVALRYDGATGDAPKVVASGKGFVAEDIVRVAKTYFVESNRTVGEFIPTTKPERAEIAAAPDLDKLFKDYKGGQSMAAGE